MHAVSPSRALWLSCGAALACGALPAALPAQSVAVPAAGAKDDTVIQLSPFEVRSEDDVGYQAANTTSGSRFNTSLKDTAASIQPFTPEFLSDIAATNVTDLLSYATNAELNAGDSEGSGFNNPRDFSSAGGEPVRVRGIPADVSTDYVQNVAPQDLYNVERAEVASGPNSILFGSGNAGGLVSLTSKKAKVDRNHNVLQAQFGSWSLQRYTADLNRVIIPKKFAFRLNALWTDSKSWRRYDYNKAKRIAPAIVIKPFERTTIHVSYERGFVQHSIGLKLNASDQVTRWMAAGRPVTDAAANAALGLASFGNNQRYTFIGADNALFNLRQELTTTTSPQPADTLLPTSIFPYDVNWAGPAPKLTQDFKSYQASIEQRVTDDLLVQAFIAHNDTTAKAKTFVFPGNTMNLYGDPNLTIPSPTGTGTVANPRAGQLYLETNQSWDQTKTQNDVRRLTIAYDLKLGPIFGEHQLAGLGETGKLRAYNFSKREILVDAANRPLANVNSPENAQNLVWRRSYLREGDYATYALTGLYTPLATMSLNGQPVSPRQINTGELYSIEDRKTLMAAAQSYWWNRRISTTLGYRQDKIDYYSTNSGRVTDATDPRVTSGQMIINEVAALPGYTINTIKANTKTAGTVVHLTKRLSGFFNWSTNTGAPRFNRRILPNGGIPPTPEGKGRDAGVMIDFLGDDRYFMRIDFFDTKQVGDAAVSPSGAVTNATTLGRAQTLAVLQAFLAAGKITQAQYDAQSFNWNAAIIDTVSRGVEVDFVANPTKAWTLRLNYSHSLRDRTNFFAEGRAFFDAKYPEWRSLAAGNATLTNTVETNITSIDQEIEDRAAAQEGGFGSIPHKATATTRYTFQQTKLKGLFVGGALRYQSKAYAQTDTRAPGAGGTGKDYYANLTLFADAFAGYRFRSPWWHLPMSLQLNVRNLTNSYLSTVARWNSDFSGARRVYLRDPRSYRLTATVEF